MEYQEAIQFLKDFNVSEEGSMTFKAASIVLVSGTIGVWDVERIYHASNKKIRKKEIQHIISNWRENNLWVDEKLEMPEFNNHESSLVIIALVALVGSGEVMHEFEPLPNEGKTFPVPALIYKFPLIQQ